MKNIGSNFYNKKIKRSNYFLRKTKEIIIRLNSPFHRVTSGHLKYLFKQDMNVISIFHVQQSETNVPISINTRIQESKLSEKCS